MPRLTTSSPATRNDALRQYLIGLLLPREHNKTMVELASIVPGANRKALHHFLHDAPWDAETLNRLHGETPSLPQLPCA